MKTILAAAVLLLALTPALASAASTGDVLIAKMEPLNEPGTVSLHSQFPITHKACKSLLQQFREIREAGDWMTLTMRNPDFTGFVLEAYCIDTDGKVHGVDGYVSELKWKS
jgi:hypothetical protein